MHPGIRGIAAILGVASLVTACSSSTETPAQSTESSPTASTPVEPAAATPLLAEVLSPPIPVPATDGKVHLAYELQLTNALGQDVTVTSVSVKAGDKSLLTLTGDRLSYWMRTLGGTAP
ncbi:MAG TPA: M23 family peptidase, partial [Mycobacterium sp.]